MEDGAGVCSPRGRALQMSVMETRCRLQRGQDQTTVDIELHLQPRAAPAALPRPRVEVGFNPWWLQKEAVIRDNGQT